MIPPTNPEAMRQAALLGYGVAVLINSIGKPRDITKDLPMLRERAVKPPAEIPAGEWKYL